MGICIVRTGGGVSTSADACTIEPRLDVAALPEPLPGSLSFALSFVIFALRVSGPIQRETVAHKPFPEITACDRTGRDRAAIPVKAERDTVDGAPGNLRVEVVRSLRTTAVRQLSSPRHSCVLSTPPAQLSLKSQRRPRKGDLL